MKGGTFFVGLTVRRTGTLLLALACCVCCRQGQLHQRPFFLFVKRAACLTESQTDRWFLNLACCLESGEGTRRNLRSVLVKLCASSSYPKNKKQRL